MCRSQLLREARSARLAKYSLDMNLLALQLSDTTLVVADIQAGGSGKQWKVECRGSDNALLRSGFIWSEHGGNSQDLVLITHKVNRRS